MDVISDVDDGMDCNNNGNINMMDGVIAKGGDTDSDSCSSESDDNDIMYKSYDDIDYDIIDSIVARKTSELEGVTTNSTTTTQFHTKLNLLQDNNQKDILTSRENSQFSLNINNNDFNTTMMNSDNSNSISDDCSSNILFGNQTNYSQCLSYKSLSAIQTGISSMYIQYYFNRKDEDSSTLASLSSSTQSTLSRINSCSNNLNFHSIRIGYSLFYSPQGNIIAESIPVAGDGNCLIYSFLHILDTKLRDLERDSNGYALDISQRELELYMAQDLRLKLAEILKQDVEEQKNRLDPDRSYTDWEQLYKDIKTQYTYLDEEVLALFELYTKKKIIVFQLDRNKYSNGIIKAVYHYNDNEHNRKFIDNDKNIYLLYESTWTVSNETTVTYLNGHYTPLLIRNDLQFIADYFNNNNIIINPSVLFPYTHNNHTNIYFLPEYSINNNHIKSKLLSNQFIRIGDMIKSNNNNLIVLTTLLIFNNSNNTYAKELLFCVKEEENNDCIINYNNEGETVDIVIETINIHNITEVISPTKAPWPYNKLNKILKFVWKNFSNIYENYINNQDREEINCIDSASSSDDEQDFKNQDLILDELEEIIAHKESVINNDDNNQILTQKSNSPVNKIIVEDNYNSNINQADLTIQDNNSVITLKQGKSTRRNTKSGNNTCNANNNEIILINEEIADNEVLIESTCIKLIEHWKELLNKYSKRKVNEQLCKSLILVTPLISPFSVWNSVKDSINSFIEAVQEKCKNTKDIIDYSMYLLFMKINGKKILNSDIEELKEQFRKVSFNSLFGIKNLKEYLANENFFNPTPDKYIKLTNLLVFSWVFASILDSDQIICNDITWSYKQILQFARNSFKQWNYIKAKNNNNSGNIIELYKRQGYLVTHIIMAESYYGNKLLPYNDDDNNIVYYKHELDWLLNNINKFMELGLWEIIAECGFAIKILYNFNNILPDNIQIIINNIINTLYSNMKFCTQVSEDKTNGNKYGIRWNNFPNNSIEDIDHMMIVTIQVLNKYNSYGFQSVPKNNTSSSHQLYEIKYNNLELVPDIGRELLLSNGCLTVRNLIDKRNIKAAVDSIHKQMKSLKLIDKNLNIINHYKGYTIGLEDSTIFFDDNNKSSSSIQPGTSKQWNKFFSEDKSLYNIINGDFLESLFKPMFAGKNITIEKYSMFLRLKGENSSTIPHADFGQITRETKHILNLKAESNELNCGICSTKINNKKNNFTSCDYCKKKYHYTCLVKNCNITQTNIEYRKLKGCWLCTECEENEQFLLFTVWIPLQDISDDNISTSKQFSNLRLIPGSNFIQGWSKSNGNNDIPQLPMNCKNYINNHNYVSHSYKIGDITVFNIKTIHDGTINCATEFRISIDIRVKIIIHSNNSVNNIIKSPIIPSPTAKSCKKRDRKSIETNKSTNKDNEINKENKPNKRSKKENSVNDNKSKSKNNDCYKSPKHEKKSRGRVWVQFLQSPTTTRTISKIARKEGIKVDGTQKSKLAASIWKNLSNEKKDIYKERANKSTKKDNGGEPNNNNFISDELYNNNNLGLKRSTRSSPSLIDPSTAADLISDKPSKHKINKTSNKSINKTPSPTTSTSSTITSSTIQSGNDITNIDDDDDHDININNCQDNNIINTTKSEHSSCNEQSVTISNENMLMMVKQLFEQQQQVQNSIIQQLREEINSKTLLFQSEYNTSNKPDITDSNNNNEQNNNNPETLNNEYNEVLADDDNNIEVKSIISSSSGKKKKKDNKNNENNNNGSYNEERSNNTTQANKKLKKDTNTTNNNTANNQSMKYIPKNNLPVLSSSNSMSSSSNSGDDNSSGTEESDTEEDNEVHNINRANNARHRIIANKPHKKNRKSMSTGKNEEWEDSYIRDNNSNNITGAGEEENYNNSKSVIKRLKQEKNSVAIKNNYNNNKYLSIPAASSNNNSLDYRSSNNLSGIIGDSNNNNSNPSSSTSVITALAHGIHNITQTAVLTQENYNLRAELHSRQTYEKAMEYARAITGVVVNNHRNNY